MTAVVRKVEHRGFLQFTQNCRKQVFQSGEELEKTSAETTERIPKSTSSGILCGHETSTSDIVDQKERVVVPFVCYEPTRSSTKLSYLGSTMHTLWS